MGGHESLKVVFACCASLAYRWGVCTAYELGKRGGSFPAWVTAEGTAELLGLTGVSIVRPTLPAPVILPDGHIVKMGWGFRLPMPGGKSRTVVNSREDKLKGRTWKGAFAERRCLIPAAAFYEWIGTVKGKVPLRFERPDDAWLWIAGIWREEGERGRVFSMITTDPNALVGPVHDRMPAVLAEDQLRPFVEGDLSEFGPSSVDLRFAEAANFLKRTPSEEHAPPPIQGDLF